MPGPSLSIPQGCSIPDRTPATAAPDLVRCLARDAFLGIDETSWPSCFFNYSTMNAGKSDGPAAGVAQLPRKRHAYPAADCRSGQPGPGGRPDRLADRHRRGLPRTFSAGDDLFALIAARHAEHPQACVFVDEAQFLEPEQVWQLARVVDDLNLPVLAYGLRVDFPWRAVFPARPPCWRWPTRCARCAPSVIAGARQPW